MIRKISLQKDKFYLKIFISSIRIGSKTFRYFENRKLESINNHFCTLLEFNNNVPVAYGHLEFKNEKLWLGISVSDNKTGLGHGKKMMKSLIKEAKNSKKFNQIFLSVDKDNYNAINLYNDFGFNIIEEYTSYYIMNRKI